MKFFLISLFLFSLSQVDANNTNKQSCVDEYSKIAHTLSKDVIEKVCAQSHLLETCKSQVHKTPIYHMEVKGHAPQPKKILVLSMVHGDELPAGYLALFWMNRLAELSNGRNTWRVVPLLNPDGLAAKTRNNARGVDLNRNLPTKNWEVEAKERWRVVEKENPRRFPGEKANSESETQCMLNHLEEFQPDFIVALHTPYGLLDFDGPEKINFALKSFKDLPWKRLGHYPGSLGRYMWAERHVPVLTVEMKGNLHSMNPQEMAFLQDSLGTFAIRLLTHFDKKSMITSAK
jgi:protein MpaA